MKKKDIVKDLFGRILAMERFTKKAQKIADCFIRETDDVQAVLIIPVGEIGSGCALAIDQDETDKKHVLKMVKEQIKHIEVELGNDEDDNDKGDDEGLSDEKIDKLIDKLFSRKTPTGAIKELNKVFGSVLDDDQLKTLDELLEEESDDED